jgi:2-methylcitrate dehydratase PrpD
MSDAIEAFIDHGLGASFDALPEAVVEAVKTFTLDTLGVGIAGARMPLTENVRRAARLWGGDGPAHVWGRDSRAMTPSASAFVNAFQIHGQEFDCVHDAAVVHPMATIMGAVIADVEARETRVSGQSLAVALAVSVDMVAGLGLAATSPLKFFRPATAGVFGATLGISRLRGFTPRTTRDAMGFALAFCSGTMQAHVEGKATLPLQIANAARAAVMACDLAEAGLPGAQNSLEGPFGYFSLFEGTSELAPVVASLGKVWRIAEVSHKPFPTGRAAQGGIVLMRKLRAQGVAAESVVEITLRGPPLVERLVGRPLSPSMTPSYARLCFQYVGARALLSGTVGLDDFVESALSEPAVHALGAKIRVLNDGSSNPAAFTPQSATARLSDGKIVRAEIDTLYGSPMDRMSREAHLEKFRACVDFGFGESRCAIADALIGAVDALEHLEDSSRLSRLAAGKEA